MNIRKVTALLLSLALLVTPVAPCLAWSEGGANLGGGWTVDTSTSGSLIFRMNGTSAAVLTANGLQTARLAVGPAGSALPTYAGCTKRYVAWGAGNVTADETATLSGTALSTDYMYIGPNSYYTLGTGLLVASAMTATGQVKAGSIALPGSAAQSAPTTGVIMWTDLTSGSPTVSLLGASGKNIGFTAYNLNGTNAYVNNIAAGNYYNAAVNGPAKFPYGLGTNGYGIDMSSGTPSTITTAVIQIPTGPTTDIALAATGTTRIGVISTGVFTARTSSARGSARFATLTGTDNLSGNYYGATTADPAPLGKGATIPAGYGVTFAGGAKPTAPAAGSVILHGGLEGGVAVLSVEKAAATTHIVTIVP